MKRTILAVLMVFTTLALTGCGNGGSSPPPTFVTSISSDPAFDGDIRQDLTGALFVRQSPLTVRAGLDPLTGDEYRGFLHFSLSTVPLDAVIVSATLDIVINSIVILPTANTIPIRIDLVALPSATLQGPEFFLNSPLPLASITFPVLRADVGKSVLVDVTDLMKVAQVRGGGLNNFQIRILEDLVAVSPGLIEIDDTNAFAPQLEVTYF